MAPPGPLAPPVRPADICGPLCFTEDCLCPEVGWYTFLKGTESGVECARFQLLN